MRRWSATRVAESLAFDTAIESPERVVAVVGVGAGLSGFDGGETADELPIVEEYERVDAAEPFDAAALTWFEVGLWVDGPGQPADRVDPAIRDLVYAMNLPLNEPDHVAGTQIRLEPPAVERLADLRCPVLAVAGELDMSSVAVTARHLEANAPDARARRVARRGAHDRDGAAGAPGDDDRRLPRAAQPLGLSRSAQRATSTIVASTSAAGTGPEKVRMSWRSTGSRSP